VGTWLVALLAGCGGALSHIHAPPPPPPPSAPPSVPARARYQYLVGRLAIEEEDWPAAEAALRTALLHDGGSPWIWLALAEVAAGEGDDGDEKQRVQEAVQAGPELPETWTRLGLVDLRAGDTRGAVDALREAVDRGAGTEAYAPLCRILVQRGDPLAPATVRAWAALPLDDLEPLRERGRLRMQLADLPGAASDLGAALVRDPSDARLLDEYLTAVTGSGLYRQGLARLATLHRLVPGNTDVLLRTYHLAAQARDWVRAAEALEALDAALPGHDAQVELWLADAYSALGRHDDARAAIEIGAACDPPLGDIGYHRARIARAAGRSADALKALRIPEKGANRADALALRARLAIDLGKPTEARRLVEDALLALPDDYVLLGALVSAAAAEGDRAGMLAAVDRMAMLDDEARARTRARSLAGMGDLDGALVALESTRLAQADSWIVGGTLLRESGRTADAVAWLEKGVDRFPRSAPLRAELGLAEDAAGNPAVALLAMREALRIDPAEARAVRYYARAVDLAGPVDRVRQVRGWLLAALERVPADAGLLDSLGQVEYALHDPLRAAEAWEEACRYAPADTALLTHLAAAYRDVGRPSQAAAVEARIQP
jgi:tetratricopeptide (TPR) repeat protein